MAALPSVEEDAREEPPTTVRCTLPLFRTVQRVKCLTKYNTAADKIALVFDLETSRGPIKVDIDNFTRPARVQFQKTAEYNLVCDALSITSLDLLFEWKTGLWYFNFETQTFHRLGSDAILDSAKIAPTQDASLEYAADGLQATILEFSVTQILNGSQTPFALKPESKLLFVPSSKLFGVCKFPLKIVLEAVHKSLPFSSHSFDDWLTSVQCVAFSDAYIQSTFGTRSFAHLFESGDDIDATTVYSKVPTDSKRKKHNESRRFVFEFKKADPSTTQWTLCGEMLIHLKPSTDLLPLSNMNDDDIVMSEAKTAETKVDTDTFVDDMFDIPPKENVGTLLLLDSSVEVKVPFKTTDSAVFSSPVVKETSPIDDLSDSFGMLSPSITPRRVGRGIRGRGRRRRPSRLFESPTSEEDTAVVSVSDEPVTGKRDEEGFLTTVNGFERLLCGIAHYKALNPRRSFGCGRIATAMGLSTNQRQTVRLAVNIAAALRQRDFQFVEYKDKRTTELLAIFFGKGATLASRQRFGGGGEYPTVGEFGMKTWTTSMKYTSAEVQKWSRKRKSKKR